MELNPNQKKVVEAMEQNILCLAPPGSGKTRVLVERAAYMIEHRNVSPYEMLLLTFTRKAAGEMRERIAERVGFQGKKITIGTFHAVALRLIQAFGDQLGLRQGRCTVYGEWETQYLLKDIAMELGIYKKSWKPRKKDIDAVFNHYYNTGEPPLETDPVYPLFISFAARLKENNSLTYGSILTGLNLLLPHIYPYLKWKHIMTDESQDSDSLQWSLVEEIKRRCKTTLFCVADPDQCQPEGTMVETINGPKPIEELNPKTDRLKAYCKHDSLIYGGKNNKDKYKFKINHRKYTGEMYNISAGNTNTQCTANHKWWVKWSNRSTKKNVVYLMRQGNRFRVGWCQLFRKGSGSVHLNQRARIERADEAWILMVFDSKKDASLYEQIVNVKYGIPTIMFTPTKGTAYYDQDGIDFIFFMLGDLRKKAEKCLKDHGRNIIYPFWKKNNVHEKQGNKHVFEIVTHNFMNSLFKVPLQTETNKIKWKAAFITKMHVKNVKVYSLDVEKYHTYIADGICTKNSIYGWRGADSEYLIRNQDKFTIYRLKVNYRSDAHIVEAANNLIKNNKIRVEKTMEPNREPDLKIVLKENITSKEIVTLYSAVGGGPETAILGRNHYLLFKVSQLMDDGHIDNTYIGKDSALTNSEEFRRFHAFLKLMVNPFDNFAFLLIKDLIDLGIDYASIRLAAAQEGKSHFQVWREKNEIYNYSGLPFDSDQNLDAATVDTNIFFQERRGEKYDEEVYNFIVDFINDNPEATIQEYLDWLAVYDVQDEIKKEGKGVQIMTIHAAKGLEFKTVIIAGMNEGILPGKKDQSVEAIEAETRLFYVAITRAKDRLIITSRPETSEFHGKTITEPVSRFVDWLKI